MKIIDERIPEDLYRKIHESVPIVCVDTVVEDGKGRFLMALRKNRPEKGRWWFVGGRVCKNERLVEAIKRKMREELGTEGELIRDLGHYEYFNEEGYFNGTAAHALVVVFLVRLSEEAALRLDAQHADYRWFDAIEPDWHPYLKESLVRAGFYEKKGTPDQ